MSESDHQQVLTRAMMSHNSSEVLQILYEYQSLTSEVLSECLLCHVKKICQIDASSENASETYIPCIKDYDVIYMLLDFGADIDKMDETGNTCLYYAAFDENCELSEILLQCGADMWAETEHGISVYDYISEQNLSKELVDVFNKFYPGLWKAVECENIYQVRQLINYWCRTNLQKNGMTLKDITLETGNEEIINLILGVCESMDLVYHIYAKNTEAIKKKLETSKRKIRLNLRKMSDHGAPILYYLIQTRDVATIELFIKHDCQVYTVMRDHMGNDMPVLFSSLTPDMSVNVLEALLPKNKPQIEEILYKIMYKGMTVLEVALEKKVDPEIFKLLIDRGGPLLLCDRNQFNETVLDIAVSLNSQVYIDAIDQSVYEWIYNPAQYEGQRLKLALLGWWFEPVQYTMENGKEEEHVTKFLSDVKLLQGYIEEMSVAIEKGEVEEFSTLKSAIYTKKLCDPHMLWYARVIGDGMPLLHKAVLFNRCDIVNNILNDKPPKESIDNLFDQYHRTALHYAFSSSAAKKIQKLLLNCGCSEHVLDKRNKEPLDFKDKQDTPAVMKMIDSLKYKNSLEFVPDPWNIDTGNVTKNELEHSEGYCSESENFCLGGIDEHELEGTMNYETDENEDSSTETASHDGEQNRFYCVIL